MPTAVIARGHLSVRPSVCLSGRPSVTLNAGHSSQEKPACPSLCLSIRLSKVWIVTKLKKDLSKFLHHTTGHLA